MIKRFAAGGMFGSDMHHAVLSAGEFVMNPTSTRKFYSQVVGQNAQRFNSGGQVASTTINGGINVSVNSSGSHKIDAVAIGRALNTELRKRTFKFNE
jgi:hypothetical protein